MFKKPQVILLYPGSFNPLHSGHLAIADWAESYYQTDVWFDLANNAFDKEEVDEEEYNKRYQQFWDIQRYVISTNEKTFICKERYIRDNYTSWFTDLYLYFLVGVDTILRIDDEKYYFGSKQEKNRVIDSYHPLTRFVVFPRKGQNLFNIEISSILRGKCIHPQGFEPINISSSELRSEVGEK